MSPIFMFPGQSSVYPGMLQQVMERWPWTEAIVSQATEILDRDMLKHYRADNPTIFSTSEDVQVGCFLTTHLHLLALERAGVHAEFSLGLSLGEYNHLVHIGAVSFEEALVLVAARGRHYDSGPRGKMLSAFPIDVETLESVLKEAGLQGVVEIACYNSPNQQVVGGETEAIAIAFDAIERETGLEPVVIEHRFPIHTSYFEPVSRAFSPVLQRATWQTPRRPYLPNVSASLEHAPSPKRFADLLTAQIHRPVLWRASIESLWEQQPDALFVEVGPRSVLYNLLSRSWLPCRRSKTDDPACFDALVEQPVARN